MSTNQISQIKGSKCIVSENKKKRQQWNYKPPCVSLFSRAATKERKRQHISDFTNVVKAMVNKPSGDQSQ